MNRSPDYIHTTWNQSLFKVLHFVNCKKALYSKNRKLFLTLDDYLNVHKSVNCPPLDSNISELLLHNNVELRKSHFWVSEYNYPTNNQVSKDRKNKKIIRIITSRITDIIKGSHLFYNIGTCETLAQKFAEQLYLAGVTFNDWKLWNIYMELNEQNLVKLAYIKKYTFLATKEELNWYDLTIKLYSKDEQLFTEAFLKCPFFNECYNCKENKLVDNMQFCNKDLLEKELKLYRYFILCVGFFERTGFVFQNKLATFWASFVNKIINSSFAYDYFSEENYKNIIKYLPTEYHSNYVDITQSALTLNTFINDCVCDAIKETCTILPDPITKLSQDDQLQLNEDQFGYLPYHEDQLNQSQSEVKLNKSESNDLSNKNTPNLNYVTSNKILEYKPFEGKFSRENCHKGVSNQITQEVCSTNYFDISNIVGRIRAYVKTADGACRGVSVKDVKNYVPRSEFTFFGAILNICSHPMKYMYLMFRGIFSHIMRPIQWLQSDPNKDKWETRHRRYCTLLTQILELRSSLNFWKNFNGAYLCGVNMRGKKSATKFFNELIVIDSAIEERPHLEVRRLKESCGEKPLIVNMVDAMTEPSNGLMDCNIIFDADGNFHIEEKPDVDSYEGKMIHVVESCEPTKVWQNDPINSENIQDDPDFRRYYWQRYRLFINFDYGIKLDKESWYSVTPEILAAQQAKRCSCDVIIDGFCGVGGNAIQLAKTCGKVIAIDLDPIKIEMARNNASIYGVEENIEFLVGDYFDLVPKLKADVVYLSPPWGGVKYAASIENYDMYNVKYLNGEIDGENMFNVARKISKNVAIYLPKSSNVFQLIEMAGPGDSLDLEYAYFNGALKSLTAYFGELAKNGEKVAR